MITLRIQVRREGSSNRLSYNGRPVVISPEARESVDRLEPGAVDCACAYGKEGLTVHAVGKAAPAADPATTLLAQVTKRLERREFAEALRDLATAGEADIMSTPILLMARIRAQQGAGQTDAAAEDFRSLLAITGHMASRETDPPVVAGIRAAFPLGIRRSLDPVWVEWVARHPDSVGMWDVDSLLFDVPVSDWPVELVLACLENQMVRKKRGASFADLLAAAEARAPADVRTVAARSWSGASS